MIEVPLTRGKVALIDDADADLVGRYKWHADLSKGAAWYARGYVNGWDKSAVRMHRLLLGASSGQIVDHINGDGLDNRRANLRFATHAENTTAKRKRMGSSVFKGVSWVKADGKWRAQIEANGVNRTIGRFDSEIEAAQAYDAAARIHHGEYATLNFPRVGERSALRRGAA